MPATPVNTLAAVLVQAAIPFDVAAFGIPYDESGVLINGISPKPTREVNQKAGRLGHKGVLTIFFNPQYMLECDFEDTLVSGKFNNKHPGDVLSIADVANYVPEVRNGFPGTTAAGAVGFSFDAIDPALRPADLRTNKINLRLVWTPQDTVQKITGATI